MEVAAVRRLLTGALVVVVAVLVIWVQGRSGRRRGRTAVRTEWRLLMATHNLTKLHRHQIATHGA